ncbi:MAG: hypothetical protein ACXAEU_02475 [Candidatus Hodarchaeales archaeon]
MVKLPICSLCAKTGILCPKCRDKVQKKQVSEIDLLVSKHLSTIERKHPKLKKAKLIETIDVPNFIILVIDQKMNEFLTNTPKVSKELEGLLKKKVTPIIKSKTLKNTLKSIFTPLEIEGLDTIYLPILGEQEELKVRLRGDVEKLQYPIETLRDIASRVTGKQIRLDLPRAKDEKQGEPVEPLY